MSENSSLTEVSIASGGPGTAPPPVVPLERLEAQICELAGHLTAATCRFLLLVGDFDARRGWESWELPSCGAWLAWKCQLAPGTAREQVRVARALRDLPVIRAGFAAGRLSYAKVRALTRIATSATEEGLAELAEPMTGGQLERFVRAHRTVTRANDQSARVARRLTWRIDDEDGSLAMTVRLPALEGQVLVQALRAAVGDLDHPHHNSDQDASPAKAGQPGAGVSAETPARPGCAQPGCAQPGRRAGAARGRRRGGRPERHRRFRGNAGQPRAGQSPGGQPGRRAGPARGRLPGREDH